MTVQNETLRHSFIGTGVETSFVFTFMVQSITEIKVVLRDPLGAETTLVEASNYTTTLSGSPLGQTGGTVDTSGVGEYGVLPSGYRLSIIIDPAVTQLHDLGSGSLVNPQSLEDGLDKQMNVAKRSRDLAGRSLRLTDGSADPPGGVYDAGGSLVKNVKDPVDPQDAATRAWVISVVPPFTAPTPISLEESSISLLNSASIPDTSMDSSQRWVLYQIPVGKFCVIEKVVIRSPSGTLDGMTLCDFGTGPTAEYVSWMYGVDRLDALVSADQYLIVRKDYTEDFISLSKAMSGNESGTNAQFSMVVREGSLVAQTCVIDTFGYLYDI
jgi:hypothetical protein